jgi:hypothetical protein
MNQAETKNDEALVPEVIDHAISLITKAEIDSQIATAHAFPRSHAKFIRDVMSMATISPEIAESCIYALPRGNKTLEGPSVRLAEMVASAYGNLRTGARVIFNDGRHVTAQGITHDLEKNIMHTEEVRRSIMQNEWAADPNNPGKSKKTGKMVPMNEDMQTVTGRAACAIAYRNSVFKVVPAALIEHVIDKIKEIIRGDIETLGVRRQKAIKYFTDLGITEARIYEAIQVKGEADIDLDKFTLLRGMASAHRNGEAMLEHLFPPPDAKTKGDKATKATEEKLNKKGSGNAAKDATDKMNNSLSEAKDSQGTEGTT